MENAEHAHGDVCAVTTPSLSSHGCGSCVVTVCDSKSQGCAVALPRAQLYITAALGACYDTPANTSS